MNSILVVEDDDGLRSVMIEGLRSAGHEVAEASNGREGLRHFRAHPTDVVITDMMMPGMEGLELIYALRSATPRPRIIAMSGSTKFSQSLCLSSARKLGAQRVLLKPFKLETLLAAITAELAAPAGPPPEPLLPIGLKALALVS